MTRVLRARNPDGREWEVRVLRVRRPLVRASFSASEAESGIGWGGAEAAAEGLVFGVLLPLLVAVVDVPARWLLSFASSGRWVEAVCWWPNEIRVSWETTRAEARVVQRLAVDALAAGYAVHDLAGARYLGWSDPPAGFGDR